MLSRFLEKVEAAEKASGEQGFVTPESLRAQLDTAAWEGLENPDSGIYKFLVSGLFKDPKKSQTGDQIDADILRTAGVISCQDDLEDKARAFYALIQDGGMEKHEFVSAADKDLFPVFEKILELSVWGLMQQTAELGVVDELYSSDEIE